MNTVLAIFADGRRAIVLIYREAVEIVIGHGILAGTYLAEYRDSLK